MTQQMFCGMTSISCFDVNTQRCDLKKRLRHALSSMVFPQEHLFAEKTIRKSPDLVSRIPSTLGVIILALVINTGGSRPVDLGTSKGDGPAPDMWKIQQQIIPNGGLFLGLPYDAVSESQAPAIHAIPARHHHV